MEKPLKNYEQEKKNGGKQLVILDTDDTAETDQLDPKYNSEAGEGLADESTDEQE